jgi:hypothetical protein
MAVRGQCPHCESDQATHHFVISGFLNEEGYCCDQFCFKAHVKKKMTVFLEAKLASLNEGLAKFQEKKRNGYQMTPTAEKYKACLVTSKIATHLLLKKDEAQYRLFRAKALEQWAELLDLSPTDQLLLRHAGYSKDFFEFTKDFQLVFFPNSSF